MLDVVMSVCGDESYFKMAEYSISSFLDNNPDNELHVFSDRPDKLTHISEKANFYDVREVEEAMDEEKKRWCKTIRERIKVQNFDNHGKMHFHETVALLPVYADVVGCNRYILKIDADSYFRGDITRNIPYNATWECLLVSRPNNGLQKPYGQELPGVGFMLWKRKGEFLKAYIDHFNGNEQETVLVELLINRKLPMGVWDYWPAHWVYPNTWLKERFTKELVDKYSPTYIHVGGTAAEQLGALEQLKGWYE
jgi:hypothetical protein